MPVLAGIPWLVPLITAIGAGGSLAATGYELANSGGGQSSASQNAQLFQQQQQQAAQTAAQQKTAFLASQPNVQSSTGGSLVGNAFNAASATAAGVPSNLNSIAQLLGNGSSGGSAPVSGGTTTPNSQQQGGGEDLASLATLLSQAA